MPQKIYFFQDNIRSVDFILIYEQIEDDAIKQKREHYLEGLFEEGLEMEQEEIQNEYNFYKIHVPKIVLCKYCDALQIRLPVKDGIVIDKCKDPSSISLNCFKKSTAPIYIPTAEFLKGRIDLFDINSENFFTPALKGMITNIVLNKIKYGDSDDDVGLEKILREDIFKAAFPLHDGSLTDDTSERAALGKEWGSFNKMWGIQQPMDRIKEYFGVKIALYFLWLGFYTYMLIPASIIGVICLIFGAATLSQDYLSKDICNPDLKLTMCPQCDIYCDFWNLTDACTYSKITYLFDNNFTIFFAIFMSFWSTLYLELWKRYSSEMTHHWGLTGFDLESEFPRPEYQAKLKRKGGINFWKHKLPSVVFSFAVAISVVSLAVAAVFSVIIYRMAIRTSTNLFENLDSNFKQFFIPVTAGLINLIAIFVLNKCYSFLAVKLTELEYQRTQTEFDDSLTLKIYIFQFVNFYSSIFYIAYFKGKFVGYPENYNRLFTYRQEECSPGGCLMELCLQLGIVMIGKQTMNNVIEILVPYFKNKIVNFLHKKKTKNIGHVTGISKQVLDDYDLQPWSSRELFPEYLEMVIQYGFVTIFVTAFPLAPLLALINNIVEIRLDAKKFIKFYRRPVAERIKDIGVWFKIINAISVFSVISNAFIIAFSSNFIPQLVYKLSVNPDYSEENYLNFSLSYFNVADLANKPEHSIYNVTECRYIGFRTPYWDDPKYNFTIMHWHVLAARLAFVVVYQNIVNYVIMIVQWAIPDVPRRVKSLIKQESTEVRNYLVAINAKRRKVNTESSNSTLEKRKIVIDEREYELHQ